MPGCQDIFDFIFAYKLIDQFLSCFFPPIIVCVFAVCAAFLVILLIGPMKAFWKNINLLIKTSSSFKNLKIAWYGYAGKACTTLKNGLINTGNAVRYGNAGKADTIFKCPKPNSNNAVGYDYAGKAGATLKNVIPNAGNTVEIARKYSCWRFYPMLILYSVRN